MIKADYSYYITEYQGSLDETSYNKLVRKSNIYIDNITNGRLEKSSEDDFSDFTLTKIKDCICAVTEYLSSSLNEQGIIETKKVSSETVGSWSVSYSSSSTDKSILQDIKGIVNIYLSGTSLLCAWC
jgi:hypothetical protein